MRAMKPAVDPQLESLRVPPHSIEAEQSVLGGLLLDNAAWDRIADFIRNEDFYRYDHRIIFQQIIKLINASRPADVITVFEALSGIGKADEVGDLSYLNALAQNTPSAANIRRYAEIVRDRGVLRKLISVADEISGQALNPQGKEVKQMLDEAESKIFAIAEEGARGAQGFQEIQPLLTQVVERIDELYNRDSQSDITGVPTGFTDLDRMTSGLQPGDLIMSPGVRRWVKPRFRSTSARTSRSKAACRSPCFRWRWAVPSWRCVCSVRSVGSTSTVCVPAA
jgi:replicative DNA helicase